MFSRNIAAKFYLFLSFLIDIYVEGRFGGTDRTMDVSPYSYPYMVAVIKDNDIDDRCAGALITTDYILTAAQCVDEVLVEVVLGSFDLTMPDMETHRTVIDNQDIIIHPYYHRDTLSYNVALLKLPENTELPARVKPVKIADSSSNLFVHEKAMLTGWGRKILFGPSTTHMSALHVTVISNNKCRRIFRDLSSIEMCAIRDYNLISAAAFECHPGTPMVKLNTRELIGIASIRYGNTWNCCGQPLVLSRISEFNDWINATTNMKEESGENNDDETDGGD